MLTNRSAVPSGCVRKTGIGSANLNGGHHAVIVVIGVEQRLPAIHHGGGLCHTNTLDIQQPAISKDSPPRNKKKRTDTRSELMSECIVTPIVS